MSPMEPTSLSSRISLVKNRNLCSKLETELAKQFIFPSTQDETFNKETELCEVMDENSSSLELSYDLTKAVKDKSEVLDISELSCSPQTETSISDEATPSSVESLSPSLAEVSEVIMSSFDHILESVNSQDFFDNELARLNAEIRAAERLEFISTIRIKKDGDDVSALFDKLLMQMDTSNRTEAQQLEEAVLPKRPVPSKGPILPYQCLLSFTKQILEFNQSVSRRRQRNHSTKKPPVVRKIVAENPAWETQHQLYSPTACESRLPQFPLYLIGISGDKQFFCLLCRKTDDISKVYVHRHKVESGIEWVVICNTCMKPVVFKSKTALNLHYATCHKGDVDCLDGFFAGTQRKYQVDSSCVSDSKLQCKICNCWCCQDEYSVYLHLSSHKQWSLMCSICNIIVSKNNRKGLQRHVTLTHKDHAHPLIVDLWPNDSGPTFDLLKRCFPSLFDDWDGIIDLSKVILSPKCCQFLFSTNRTNLSTNPLCPPHDTDRNINIPTSNLSSQTEVNNVMEEYYYPCDLPFKEEKLEPDDLTLSPTPTAINFVEQKESDSVDDLNNEFLEFKDIDVKELQQAQGTLACSTNNDQQREVKTEIEEMPDCEYNSTAFIKQCPPVDYNKVLTNEPHLLKLLQEVRAKQIHGNRDSEQLIPYK